MNEYITAACTGNESKSFGIIEPLHCTIFHCELPPSCVLKLTEKAKKIRKAKNVFAVTLQVHPELLDVIMPCYRHEVKSYYFM
jgi:hypothetical protein